MQTFPFERGAPGGVDFANGQRLNPDAINTIDLNAAQAADGNIWSDRTALRNFTKTARSLASSQAIFWDLYNQAWILGYTSATNTPAVDKSVDGNDDWIALTSPASGSNWNLTSAGASKQNGTIVLGGGGGGSSTAAKIRQTADGGATWANRNTIASGTENVTCLGWWATAGLFVGGLSSTASTNIETSPDGITWTQRTGLGNSDARGKTIAFGNGIAVMGSGAAAARAIRSSDAGVSWGSVAMPSSAVWGHMTFNEGMQKFVSIAPGLIATSADGNTWSTVGLTAPLASTILGLVSIGRLLVATGALPGAYGILVSDDGGVTWALVKSFSTAPVAMGSDEKQVVCVTASAVYSSLRIG